MKAYLDVKGVIHIEAETPVEAYALSHWTQDNCRSTGVCGEKMIFDWSLSLKEGKCDVETS